MVFSEDFDPDGRQARKERREGREEFLQIAEDKEIAEGDISVSETVSGHDPQPDAFDEDFDDELDEEGMHIMDEEEFERLENPYDADGYLDDEDED